MMVKYMFVKLLCESIVALSNKPLRDNTISQSLVLMSHTEQSGHGKSDEHQHLPKLLNHETMSFFGSCMQSHLAIPIESIGIDQNFEDKIFLPIDISFCVHKCIMKYDILSVFALLFFVVTKQLSLINILGTYLKLL